MTAPAHARALSGPSSLRVPPHSPAESAALDALAQALPGNLRRDDVHRALYSTDASIYEITPIGVAFPRSTEDLQRIVRICVEHRVPITMRGAGTSLAGQAIGPGLIVDAGRHMNRIGRLDLEARTLEVEPGVIQDDINRFLKPHRLKFGPDTSTSNRCMIGGMIGNNSCGSHSILYGTTRDHVVSVDVVLSDGSLATVRDGVPGEWEEMAARDDRLGDVARRLRRLAGERASEIRARFPKPEVLRRNTGYAIDDLANSRIGDNPDREPSLVRLLCGSEGTLALTARATIRLVPVQSSDIVVVAHFATIDDAMVATVEAVRHGPAAVELLDKRLLDLASLNSEQRRYRWFVEGDPGAILVIEFFGDSDHDVTVRAEGVVASLRAQGLGYAWPIVKPPRIGDIWELRKAGLGILNGAPGDVKPVTLVEDTAVAVPDLPAYIRGFHRIMAKYGASCVYYAHASVGELHLRPELDFKEPGDVERARGIITDVTDLIREFRGSISGEHGDGRLRGPFIARSMSDEVMAWLVEVKDAFDPERLLNPAVIVETAPFEQDWRYPPSYRSVEIAGEFRYSSGEESLQQAVERCNGTGVCRRPAAAGGTMCPSYMATGDEQHSTRGRANLFRRLIQEGSDALYASSELRDSLDLCLSCKGCRNDCPSSVDMAKLKAEFLQGWNDRHGAKASSRAFAGVTELLRPTQWVPGAAALTNAVQRSKLGRKLFQSMLGIDARRALPEIAPRGFHADFDPAGRAVGPVHGAVLLYVDEFTDRYEPRLGHLAVELLRRGGWTVLAPRAGPSGRTWISKGFVRTAREHISRNLDLFAAHLDEVEAILGVEPSAILTYVDESIDLALDSEARDRARRVAQKVRLVDAFIVEAVKAGKWNTSWTDKPAELLVHGHCHQKSLASVAPTVAALSLPGNHRVKTIPSGCCGMAGSFGYEREHHDLSIRIGELVLFPAVREAADSAVVVAPGTSCRHQVFDGTGRVAVHPIEILARAAT